MLRSWYIQQEFLRTEGISLSGEPNRLQVFFAVQLGARISRPYKRYVDSFGLVGNEMVLDYGSGWGRISQHIVERLSQGGHLTCVDVSKVWIEALQKRLEEYSNVDYKLGDIVALDIADSAYDIVVVHNVLHHVAKDEQQEKVAILARKLKPHGRLFIREFTRAEHGTPTAEIRALMSAAGLHERESRMTRSVIMGEVFDGVFDKP
jgi:ubiquinone/menaquinone biosynthesis C-methylase UbiE